MGPTTKDLNVTGAVTFAELRADYYEQAKGLVEGGADFLLIETCHDTRSVKAGAARHRAAARANSASRIPVMVSGTIEPMGTMLAGQTADAFYASVAHADLLADRPELRHRSGVHDRPHPHAARDVVARASPAIPTPGCRTKKASICETPESLAAQLEKFVDHGWLNIVGGCCGTTPAHIQAIAQMVEGKQPRAVPAAAHRAYYSGIELVEAEDSNRPLIVGERTNVIGSRLFKNLVAEEKWEEATEIARWQVQNGAHIIDVCLQSTDRDEIKDIPPFYEKLIRKIKAPIMIDTTDPKAVELALT